MAKVLYVGRHPEPSITMRVPRPDNRPVWPFDVADEFDKRRNEAVAFPQGVWRPVSPFVAIYLAAVRRRTGPWFTVRLAKGEWDEIRRRAPWIVRAKDARRLVDPDQTAAFVATELRPYEVG